MQSLLLQRNMEKKAGYEQAENKANLLSFSVRRAVRTKLKKQSQFTPKGVGRE